MSEQQTTAQERPAPEGHIFWPDYWAAQGMPWRTEPEVDEERQRFLAERRAIQPNIEKGVYPFKDIRLSRADVEWLLAAHQDGKGPVLWNGQNHWTGEGLDLRGANLIGQDFSALPLACSIAGLSMQESTSCSLADRQAAAAQIDDTDLSGAHLEGAFLKMVRFRRAKLDTSHLEWAELWEADFEEARMTGANLSSAILFSANLKAADLADAILTATDLRRANFDERTALNRVVLCLRTGGIAPWLVDVRWGGANLSAIDWDDVSLLFDEYVARKRKLPDWESHEWTVRKREANRGDYIDATRACRQLAIALRSQGLKEAADQFDYRGKVLHRGVLRRQGRWGVALGSTLLDLVAGYGYRPLRSFIAYVLIICLFAGAFLVNAQFAAPHLTWDEALVLSISSFHGRGFFTSGINLGDTLARIAAGEAVVGLFIEITFIATFTQRFFAR